MPARADIDPASMRAFLPNVYLVDVLGPFRFRVRLVGTYITRQLRRDITGRMVDEASFGDQTEPMQRLYERVVQTKAPVFSESRAAPAAKVESRAGELRAKRRLRLG